MSPIRLFVAALALFVYAVAAGQVVDLGYARYRGNLSYPNTVAFLGVPYAEPPVGERRWRAPAPLDTTRVGRQSRGQIIDVSKSPNFCVQASRGGAPGYCLL